MRAVNGREGVLSIYESNSQRVYESMSQRVSAVTQTHKMKAKILK